MSTGLEIRAAIDTETVKALQFINGGAAAGLMALLPLIVEKPGLNYLAVGTMRGITCTAAGLALAVIHNRLRRKCSLEYDKSVPDRKRPCRWAPSWIHSAPNEACVCTRSVAAMWLSLLAFVAAAVFVVTGALRQLDHPAPVLAASPRPQQNDAGIRAVHKGATLFPLNIDHADKGFAGFVCIFYFDAGLKRYHLEVNAPEATSCPQVIWLGDRP